MVEFLRCALLCLLTVCAVALHAGNGELPKRPYTQEDGARFAAARESAQKALPAAQQALAQAREAAAAPDLAAEEQQKRAAALAAAEVAVKQLEDRIAATALGEQEARGGPTAAQLQARRSYDAKVVLARKAAADLADGTVSGAPEGELTRVIREAEDELARRASLVEVVDGADVRKSRVYERMNDIEKVEFELRWAQERFKVKIDEYDQLVDGVFAAYRAYETRAFEAMQALDEAAAELKDMQGSPAAAPETGGPFLSEAEHAALRQSLRELRQNRRGMRSAAADAPLRIARFQGRLREIQRAIDLREDYRDHLEIDAERLKDRLAAENRAARPVAAAEPKIEPDAEYQKLQARIDELEAEIRSAREELARLTVERESLARLHQAKQDVETEVEGLVAETGARITALNEEFGPRGVHEFRPGILIFTLNEELEARSERLGAARLDTRQARTRLDIVDRRIQRLNDRIAQIEQTDLPNLQSEYMGSIGRTIAVRALWVVLIFAGAWLLLWVIKRIGSRMLERMMRRAEAQDGADAYQRQRKRTLFTVFVTTARVVVFIMAVMFALAQFDVDYGPLLVAAGGVSLAIGFGAQSLVKDFFAGFFILLEGQFSIGDVVEISGKTGTVENLNLRTTVLRSVNGDVHTIPNGEIRFTSNLTKVWSRAVLDIAVAYEENVDDIIALLEAVGREMQQDEIWSRKLQEVIIAGVDSFGDSSVNVRVLLRTRAGEQWGAAREYRRRVKLKFDELGIEIPWPQRVVSYKEAEADGARAGRAQRAQLLRYVRRMRGEREEDEELAAVSVEERDRADTIARQQSQAQQAEEAEQGQAVKPPVPDEAQMPDSLAPPDEDEPKK